MVRSTLLWLPAVASSTRVTEQVGMMQVNAAAQVFALDGKATTAETMLETVKTLARKNEKPSADTKSTLQTIQGLLTGLETSLGQEKESLQNRATDSTSMIAACDAAWTSAESARANAEQIMNNDEAFHADCRQAESEDLADRTSKCSAMSNLHQTMTNNVCSMPSAFDRDNSETYLSCVNNFWTTYENDNTQKIANCEGAETEYTRQKGECNGKQDTFEEAACAHYTTHAAMCSAYSECRPAAVQDFEAKTAAIGLEETSLKNQYKVVKTVACYVKELLEDDSDATEAALACDQEDYPTTTYDITYPAEPAEKPCTVRERPCETAWLEGVYSTLPSDAQAETCAPCPEYARPVEAFQKVDDAGATWALVMKLSKNDFCYGSSKWTDGEAYNADKMTDDAMPAHLEYDAKHHEFHRLGADAIKLQTEKVDFAASPVVYFQGSGTPENLMTTNDVKIMAHPDWNTWKAAFGSDRNRAPAFVRAGEMVLDPAPSCRISSSDNIQISGCGKPCMFCMMASDGSGCPSDESNDGYWANDISAGVGNNEAYCGGGNANTCSSSGLWSGNHRVLVWARIGVPA